MNGGDFLDGLDERLDIARRLLRTPSPSKLLEQANRLDNFNVSLLYGYVRSFVSLAFTGDVEVAARSQGQTRQTVKRHILELENLLETALFEQVGARSRLTEMGALWLPRAQEFSELASAFLNRKGLNDAEYRSTQIPLRMLLNDGTNSQQLRHFALCWMEGEKSICSGWFEEFSSSCIVYRRIHGAWGARSIGSKSAFRLWYGAEMAQQSEGKTLENMASGDDLGGEVNFLLDSVYTRGGLHFSEVACKLDKPGSAFRVPVLYQRLIAEFIDELERPVVVSIIRFIDPQRDPVP